MNTGKRLLFVVALVLAGSANSAEVKLVSDGVAKCRVVVSDAATAPERFGAEELATYLDKTTGCGALNGDYPIRISVKPLPELKEDGFVLDVRTDGLDVIGANPRGALYGCYEILKRFAGVRWLLPGSDGEYVSPAKTVSAPVGRIVRNPSLRMREARCHDSVEGCLWLVRNNMLAIAGRNAFFDKDGRLSPTGALYEKLTVRGTGISGHMMSALLLGVNAAYEEGDGQKKVAEKLYAVHPEYFPLVGGKRQLIWSPGHPNPCISNPAVLDIMASNFVARLSGPHGSEAYSIIDNNDTTVWCECEKCRALDPPETKGTRGELSDRYWWFLNELGRRVWAVLPDAHLSGAAYQNFWFAPVRVKPDPRFACQISYNNQCWRHSVCEAKCSVNKTMCDIYRSFKKTGLPLVYNRDEIGNWDSWGSPGCELQPAEGVFARNCVEYPEIGCNGSHLCVPGPVPAFVAWAKNQSPYFGKRYHWYAMWQTCYVAALMMYDRTTDWQDELERANRLFYGAAWDGGMREFRALLTKCFLEAPGCVGWGQGAPMGRCLDQAGSEEKLKALLEQAIASAGGTRSVASAGGTRSVASAADTEVCPPVDARALQHVLREKEIFELTWLVQRQKYLENFKELNVYRRAEAITVDGVLDESDWKNADAVSDFRDEDDPKKAAEPKTYVRVTYDRDTLYIGVEAMEPSPETIASPAVGSDDLHRLGDRIELFYNYPDMADRAYHLCINSRGTCIAARQNTISDRQEFKTAAKWATKVGKDRWTLEIAIPCSEIGQNCFDGASWKFNVGRERLQKGQRKTESSSCCKGKFHGPANFMNLKFCPARVKGISQGTAAASWVNGDFNAHRQLDRRDKARFKNYVGEDDREPLGWNVMDVFGQYHRRADDSNNPNNQTISNSNNDNWYLTLRYVPGNNVRQYFKIDDAATVKAIFKARGKGRLRLWTCSFVRTPDGKDYNADGKTQQERFFDMTSDWKTFEATVKKAALPTDRIGFWFCADKNSEIDLDDVTVTRVK